MAGDSKKLQPIIVKKIKKGGHGHHGGAWKIAYADFVTAMMAFFLLMWLLGSTAQGDLEGIADYFQNPLKLAMQGGEGTGDSSSIIKGGGEDLSRKVGQVRRGDTPSTRAINLDAAPARVKSEAEATAQAIAERRERARLIDLKGKLDLASVGLAPAPTYGFADAEVIAALTGLGYSVAEAQAALRGLPSDEDLTTEEKIFRALQSFGGAR